MAWYPSSVTDEPALGRTRSIWAQRFSCDPLVAPREPRVHDHMAIALITAGTAVVEQRGRFLVAPGDVYVVPAGARHRIVEARAAEAWGLGFDAIRFASPELAPLLEPFARAATSASTIVRLPSSRQAHVERLFAEIHRESADDAAGAHKDIVTASLLSLVLAELVRADRRLPDSGAGVGFVSEALRFIQRSCLGPLSLGEVAAHVSRSPSHVSTAVRRETGQSIKDWIILGRLAEARRRLLHTDEMVDVIAERVGYADPTHFIRIFRRQHGATPAAWRAHHRAAFKARPRRAPPSARD